MANTLSKLAKQAGVQSTTNPATMDILLGELTHEECMLLFAAGHVQVQALAQPLRAKLAEAMAARNASGYRRLRADMKALAKRTYPGIRADRFVERRLDIRMLADDNTELLNDVTLVHDTVSSMIKATTKTAKRLDDEDVLRPLGAPKPKHAITTQAPAITKAEDTKKTKYGPMVKFAADQKGWACEPRRPS